MMHCTNRPSTLYHYDDLYPMKKSGCVSRNTAVLLLLSALWVCISEVGVHYVYSSQWEWPKVKANLDDRKVTKHDPGVALGLLADHHRHHYQYEDTHYYTTGLTAVKGVEETGLRVLILSDPHIMCTYDK